MPGRITIRSESTVCSRMLATQSGSNSAWSCVGTTTGLTPGVRVTPYPGQASFSCGPPMRKPTDADSLYAHEGSDGHAHSPLMSSLNFSDPRLGPKIYPSTIDAALESNRATSCIRASGSPDQTSPCQPLGQPSAKRGHFYFASTGFASRVAMAGSIEI